MRNSVMKSLAIFVLSLSTAVAAFAQGAVVTGRVLDEQNEPMIAAGVMQKGTTNGSVTDLDGAFRLVVPKGATIVVTTIGYLPQEYVITGDTNLEVKMELDTQMIEETVVVGYGVQKKSDVTGAISQVKSEDIQNLREAIENEESDTLVSNERIQSCMDSHRRSIEKTWDQTFLSDKLTYLKLAQMRDLNQMLKKTDPALHINSSQFSALKTAMGRLVTMTDSRNLNLNNPAHRKQLSDQLGVIREACEAWLDKENTKTNRSNHQRYGMVLGILGCIDPLAAERKLIENRSPLKYNGEAIGPEEFRSMSYRPDGKSQSSAELLSQMVIRLAGTKYSGWTEKKRQEYYKRVVDRDLRREQNALKNPQKQERELIQTVNDPVQQRKHGKH